MQTNIKKRSNFYKGAYRDGFSAESDGERLEIFVKSKLRVYKIIPVEKVKVDMEEFAATRAQFTVKKDDVISFNQGDAVSIKYMGEGLFFGYVFTKCRERENLIDVVCYDQLRYMKNRRTYTRGRMRLDEIVNKIADDYYLKKGEIEKCGVMLEAVAADNVSLLDVVKKACSDVKNKNGERYIVFDDCGEIVLKNEKTMVTDIVIDEECVGNYKYTDTIDENVYNMVEVYSDKKRYNTRYTATVSDKESMQKWGTLILSKKATVFGNEESEAKNLLKEYNRIQREIIVKSVPGDRRMMPGGSLYVKFDMGDLSLDGYVRVKKAVHVFENNTYLCDVYLDGSDVE